MRYYFCLPFTKTKTNSYTSRPNQYIRRTYAGEIFTKTSKIYQQYGDKKIKKKQIGSGGAIVNALLE